MATSTPTEIQGKIMYNTRNYNPNHYKLDLMKQKASASLIFNDFAKNIGLAKVLCLSNTGRDIATPMFALERDEEYFPEFKECVKDSMQTYLQKRQEADPTCYGLAEGMQEEAIARGLDYIKLAELKDNDYRIYEE